MEAGRLDRKITIKRFTETRDAFNNPVQTWADLATVWASVEHIRDAERWSAQEVVAEATMRFQVRYSSTVADVSPNDQLTYDGRTFNIVAVKEIGRREGLELTASARTD